MRKLFDIVKIGWQANERRLLFYNQVPRRGIRYQENIKWVRPEKKPMYHSARTGDLVEFPALKYDDVFLPFKDSKELENADINVKKMFSLGYQLPKDAFETYQHELVEKVKRHALDNSSVEVKIAKLTAKIRYYQQIIFKRPSKNGPLRLSIKLMIDKRKKLLKELRLKDYKKFEWLLDKLDLEYRPPVQKEFDTVTRKKSLVLLARLKVEQAKEERLAELKKKFDEQKIPFLEKKIMKLKQIREMEEKNNLDVTVKDEDIENCIKKLEEVKIQIDERQKRGYKRKIHPFFLEPYDEDLLWEKEKAGELIREKQETSGENKLVENTS